MNFIKYKILMSICIVNIPTFEVGVVSETLWVGKFSSSNKKHIDRVFSECESILTNINS